MRALNLDQLRTLVTIADLGSFADASRALHLAAPTVSLHISELEARLGARLLLRTRGAVIPTGIGDTLLLRARQLLADADRALEEIERQLMGKLGRVRVGASTGALAHLLPRALEILGKEHPGIDVQVAVLTSEVMLERIRLGALEIGLIALPQQELPGLKVIAWRRDPVKAFVPASWLPLAQGHRTSGPRAATPNWLAGKPLILNDSSTRLNRMTLQWFADAGESPKPRIELNFNDAMKSLVAAGYGAALLPVEAEAQSVDARIAVLPLRPKLWRPLGLACRAGLMEPAARSVFDVLLRLKQV